MTERWYIKKNGTIIGPLSQQALILSAANGAIAADTEVSIGQNGPWALAFQVSDLFERAYLIVENRRNCPHGPEVASLREKMEQIQSKIAQLFEISKSLTEEMYVNKKQVHQSSSNNDPLEIPLPHQLPSNSD